MFKKNREDKKQENGANNGDRTRDNRNHNPGLYQLSYIRHSRNDTNLANHSLKNGTPIRIRT